jgi:hypothetical protein
MKPANLLAKDDCEVFHRLDQTRGVHPFRNNACRRTTFPAFSRLEAHPQPDLDHGSDARPERAASDQAYQSASEAPG